jgi:hypothetical protein
MKLEVDCGLKNKRKKVTITYENLPTSIFLIDEEEINHLRTLEQTFLMDGPDSLKEFEKIYIANPKSLYVATSYFQALRAFEFLEEAQALFKKIKQKFPQEILTNCIDAHYALEDGKEDNFIKQFKDKEILKIAFPKRSLYHYKEALAFHSMWSLYWNKQQNKIQAEKHIKFIALIMNTWHTFFSSKQPVC